VAPSQFKIGGTQHAGTYFTDGVTLVLPAGSVAGVSSRSAQPGDTIVFYGIGFGPVKPNIPAGLLVSQSNQLIQAPQFLFGQTPGTISYAGLAPGGYARQQRSLYLASLASPAFAGFFFSARSPKLAVGEVPTWLNPPSGGDLSDRR
jgi:uncharacterized protein (TIGR03437 family)